MGYIYALLDPRDQKIRYIGQTITTLNQRFRKHLCDCKSRNNHVSCWLKSLLNVNLKPAILQIEECDNLNLDDKEIFYIDKYKQEGFDLTNCSLGGQTRRIFSEETKRKISEALKGKTQSLETRQKRSESLKETWKNPELRELKRRQTTELIRLGLIPTRKGEVSKRKIMLESLPGIVEDYNNIQIPVNDIANKYKISRGTLFDLMRRNDIKLRKSGNI